MAELTDELKVLITAEVDKAIKNMKDVDKQAKKSADTFKMLGKTISAAFVAKEIIDFGKASIAAYEEHTQVVNVLNSTIKTTGAVAWTSSRQLQDMANTLERTTNYAGDSINQMQSVLLGFRNIKGDTFEDATKAILDMATVMRMDLSSAAQAVGKALDDPINGIDSLRRQGFNFTDSQKEMIKSLLDAGDAAAAQKVILDELNGTYGGAAEAAVTASNQIANAWNALQTNFGTFISGTNFGQTVADSLYGIADAFQNSGETFAMLAIDKGNYQKTFDYIQSLGNDYEQMAYLYHMAVFRLNQLYEENKNVWNDEKLNKLNNALTTAVTREQIYQSIVDVEQKNADQTAKITAEIGDIENVKLEVAKEFSILAKNDDNIQIEILNKKLDEITQTRNYLQEELSKDLRQVYRESTDNGDGTITYSMESRSVELNLQETLAQLDYSEAAILKKIQEIKDKAANVKPSKTKTWQEVLSDLLGIPIDSFQTGTEAVNKYLNQTAENAVEVIGAMPWANSGLGVLDYYRGLEDSVQDIIRTLLTLPPDAVDEAFKVDDNTIKGLQEVYRIANTKANELEISKYIVELNKQVNELGLTERTLTLRTYKDLGATEDQLLEISRLLGIIEDYDRNGTSGSLAKGPMSWEEVLEQQLLSGIEKLNLFKKNAEEANSTVAKLGVSLTTLALNSAMTGISALGKALGEGKDAGDALSRSLADMAAEILKQLPTLMLNAGLTLISQGNWPLGLGLVTAGLGSQLINGWSEGYTNSLTANAKGGVYGNAEMTAFAKGGAFTNQIVSTPTLFRFARGSGFGTGLMGEAGPEAIMPLKRGADGSLGVMASGTGSTILVEVNNYSPEKIETRESYTDNGEKKLTLIIGSAINKHLGAGKADKVLSSRYGLRAQGV